MSHRWITFGRDKKGRATLIVRPRFHNVDEFPMDQMVRYGIFMVEKAIRLTESYGHKQYVVILDRHGVQRHNQDLKFMQNFVNTTQGNYPERMGMVCIVELGWLFKIGFAVVKNFLSRRTVDKIKLLNTHADLKQYFDDDQLMKEHGGTAEWEYDGAKDYAFE